MPKIGIEFTNALLERSSNSKNTVRTFFIPNHRENKASNFSQTKILSTMKITLFSIFFILFSLSLIAQKNQTALLEMPLLFKREYQNKEGRKFVLQVRRPLSSFSQTSDASTFLILDTEHTIQLNSTHREKIRDFLRASILKRDCISSESTLNLGSIFKMSLASKSQECYYILKVGRTKVNLPFGEGLNLLRKLIASK